MDYVANYGAQFGYATICEGAALTFNCFYGSNVSVRREMLAELTHLFDEDFQTYGWEDTELGYRLERAGMRLVYHRKALALHDHSTNVREFCQRQYIVGKSSRILAQKHPQLAPSLGKLEEMHAWSGWKPLWGLAEQGVNLIDKLFRIPLPMRWYRYLLVKNYAEGVLSADRHGVPPGDPGGNQTVALASQATIGEDWPTTEIAPRLPREVPELCLPGAPYVDQMGPARAFEDLPVGP
jgi:hypothetical protein